MINLAYIIFDHMHINFTRMCMGFSIYLRVNVVAFPSFFLSLS